MGSRNPSGDWWVAKTDLIRSRKCAPINFPLAVNGAFPVGQEWGHVAGQLLFQKVAQVFGRGELLLAATT